MTMKAFFGSEYAEVCQSHRPSRIVRGPTTFFHVECSPPCQNPDPAVLALTCHCLFPLDSHNITSILWTMQKIIKRSPIALAALAMLYEAPMHPYRMQQLIKERGKDEVINVGQRASLYQTIGRLEREGLISAQKVTRDENRPERTVYELTDAVRAITLDGMREIWSTPAPQLPAFPAPISVLPVLTPTDALR